MIADMGLRQSSMVEKLTLLPLHIRLDSCDLRPI